MVILISTQSSDFHYGILSYIPVFCSYLAFTALSCHHTVYKPGQMCSSSNKWLFFFAVTAIATGIPLPPSRVSAAASAVPTSTVMRWTQVCVVDSLCSLMSVTSQVPVRRGLISLIHMHFQFY